MDVFEFRRLREEEFGDAVRLDEIAFAEQHPAEDVPFFQTAFDFERSFCAFDRGRLAGISSALPLELTLPGGALLPIAGVTWIAVLPTHRRLGILTRLIRHQFEEARARGEAAAALIAAEGSIYGRFGMGPATSIHTISVDRARAAFVRPPDREGRLILLRSEEAAAQLPPLFDGLRRRGCGEVSRSSSWWAEYLHDPEPERDGAGAMLHVLHESSTGKPDGYATYRVKEEWKGWTPANQVRLLELMAADREVYAALWHYLLNLDLTRGVWFERARTDEPLRWLLADPRALQVEALIDYLWLRPLDLPRALAARRYGARGDLVLEVVDRVPTQRSSRIRLRADDNGAASCHPAEQEPDLSLDLSTLAAAYLGDTSFAALASAGRVTAAGPDVIERADALFATKPAPYCTTMF